MENEFRKSLRIDYGSPDMCEQFLLMQEIEHAEEIRRNTKDSLEEINNKNEIER